jgi:hypothetical protein
MSTLAQSFQQTEIPDRDMERGVLVYSEAVSQTPPPYGCISGCAGTNAVSRLGSITSR